MKKLTINQIKKRLTEKPEDTFFLKELESDTRRGVQQLLRSQQKQREYDQELKQQFTNMNTYENSLKKEGYLRIAGIDEVGRGPLAGPVVAASVVLPDDFYLLGLTDSKKLSKQKRENYAAYIHENALAVGIGIATASEIDQHNIYEATKIAMSRALDNINYPCEYLLLDAMKLPVDLPQTSLIQGDSKSISIAAASVVAKVTRDEMMEDLAEVYPAYRFDNHMGYGTKDHLEALNKHGATKEHRKSFAPVKAIL
ncbi:ribonuclease HII [Alteribacter populi]|uniref:ribonuclease HII n=1 Tax=Alteribacter populi TaxID=2011011 RepID=UPI000BBB3A23|nr:ribonuclease HII [Alteribacter populi]